MYRLLIASLVALFLMTQVQVCLASKTETNEDLETARELVDDGAYPLAIPHFVKALEDVKNEAIYLELGQAYRVVGLPRAAFETYVAGVKRYPQSLSLLTVALDESIRCGKLKAAKTLVRRIVKIDSNFGRTVKCTVLVALGEAAYKGSQYSKALKYFDKALKYEPYRVSAQRGVAMCNDKLDD